MRLLDMCLVGSVVLGACSAPVSQSAATGAAVLEKHGLVGRWAQDCTQPYSSTNPHLIYAVPNQGVPTEQLLMDRAHDRTSPIDEIKELSNGMVQWTQQAGDDRVTVVTKFDGNRQKTWTSTTASGTVYIEDGKFSGGEDAPWFSKCETN